MTDRSENAVFIPRTPAGALLAHLEAPTRAKAWKNLLADAKHMPYKGQSGFEERGYTVVELRDD